MNFSDSRRATYLNGAIYFTGENVCRERQLYLFRLGIRSIRGKACLLGYGSRIRDFIPTCLFTFNCAETGRCGPNIQVLYFNGAYDMMRKQSNDERVQFRFQSILFCRFSMEQTTEDNRGDLTFFRFFRWLINFITNNVRNALYRLCRVYRAGFTRNAMCVFCAYLGLSRSKEYCSNCRFLSFASALRSIGDL